MAGLAEWWRSMPRSKQLMVALAAFWLVYLCAAVFEWLAPGSLQGASYYASDTMTAVASDVAAERDLATAAAGGITGGDLVVLLAAAFIAATLGSVAVVVWRETHETKRDPGMGDGDDPLWSGGFDMDLGGDDRPGVTA